MEFRNARLTFYHIKIALITLILFINALMFIPAFVNSPGSFENWCQYIAGVILLNIFFVTVPILFVISMFEYAMVVGEAIGECQESDNPSKELMALAKEIRR